MHADQRMGFTRLWLGRFNGDRAAPQGKRCDLGWQPGGRHFHHLPSHQTMEIKANQPRSEKLKVGSQLG